MRQKELRKSARLLLTRRTPSTSGSNCVYSIAENLSAARLIKRHKIASGEAKAQEAVCLQTATDNVLWGRLISKVSAHHGVVASSMTAIRTNALEATRSSAVLIRTPVRSRKDVTMRHGEQKTV